MINYANNPDVIELQEDSYIENFNNRATYFVDSAQHFSAENLWTETMESKFDKPHSLSYSRAGTIWVRFYVRNESVSIENYILLVGGHKHVTVYYKKLGATSYSIKETGIYVPFPKKELGDYHFRRNKVRLQLQPGATYEVVVQYVNDRQEKTGGVLTIAGERVWLEKAHQTDMHQNLILGVFFGISLFLAIVNFIYFFVYKDKAYLYYCLFICALIYYEASIYGMFDGTALVQVPKVYFSLESLTLISSVICYFLFLKQFANTRNRFPVLNKLVNYTIIILLINVALTLWFLNIREMPRSAMITRNYILLFIMPLAVIVLASLYKKGTRTDHIFILGSFMLIISGVTSLLVSINSNYFNSDLFFQIGVILELIIFSAGLGVRSRTFEREKQEAQARLIVQLRENEKLQLNINEKLEREVEQRTMEIQSQNEELVQQQEELAAQRDSLENQNRVIEKSMHELDEIKKGLEKIVEERTRQLKQANAELVNHNSQLEQYAFVTAHNLRGPVARLKGLVYVLEKTKGTTPENKEVIDKIYSSALEMDDVLSDMNAILELKKGGNNSLESVDLKKVVDKVCKRTFDELTDCGGIIEHDLGAFSVRGNEPYMESIFYNLISNAIKYRSDERQLRIRIGASKLKNNLRVSVTDNGLGIDLDRFGNKLFGFYQRFHDHVGGKGLGLYLVKTQVESMLGSISVESEIGKGTTFILEFPA